MDQLHFLHPLWLLALLPLALLWWFTIRSKVSSSKSWEKVIDAKLLPLLLSGSDKQYEQSTSLVKWGLALIWFISTIALADPVWEKVPRPVFQTNTARVIVLDLSNSMQIADLKPSRIARARFKIEDILSSSKEEEGQLGLVLFAGDAFTASPLTRDSETIRALLQVLSPDIMPSQGSRVDLGLKKAHELLKQAGVNSGQVLLIADGVSDQDLALEAAKKLRRDGHKLSVLGVGTEIGGELPQIKYQNGDRITVALDSDFLQAIAKAGGGKYHLLSTSNADLKSVLSTNVNAQNANKPEKKNEDVKGEDWKSTGPFIVLLLLPFAALAFRRGWLFNIVIVASLIGLLQPQPVLASPLTESLSESWNNLWINKEQQAEIALKKQQYDKANKLSENPLMQGTASYKKEDFKKALEEFKQVDNADARYNEGNALAKLKKYEEAIKAYDEALKKQPDMEDAKKNKAAIEKLLKEKQKQEQKQKNKKQQSGKDSKDNKEKKGDKKDQKNDPKKESKNNKQSKDGKQGKSSNDKNNKDDKDKKQSGKKDGKQSKNQFSDANKDLKKQKPKEGEEESTQAKDKKEQKKSEDQKASDKTKEKDAKKTTHKKAGEKSKGLKEEKAKAKKGKKSEAEELTKEEKMAAEQWLRRIPDDPGGLLRRKFKYQYQQRKNTKTDTKQPW